MRPLQQDDIQDSFNEPKRKFRFIHLPTGKIIRAETKRAAIRKIKEVYNIDAKRKETRQTRYLE